MFIKNFSGRERTLLIGAVIIAVMALLYVLVLEPLAIQWKSLDSQIDAKVTALMKDTRLLAMYSALERDYEKYRGFIDAGKDEDEEITSALGEIESISQESACYIVNVKPRSAKTVGNYKEISFEVTTEGTIGEIARFIYEIEMSEKYLRIRRFTILSKSGPAGNLKAVFLISKIIAV